MKQQISRLSPHQNGKVFAVLMAVSSFVFLVPILLVLSFSAPSAQQPPLAMFLMMPVMYLVIGYFMVAIGCVAYNLMFKYIGGIEYESQGRDA